MAHRSTKTHDSRVSSIWEFCNKLRFDKLLKFKRKLQFLLTRNVEIYINVTSSEKFRILKSSRKKSRARFLRGKEDSNTGRTSG